MQPFQGKKLKITHRASSQQTDAALSRLQVLGCRMNLIPDKQLVLLMMFKYSNACWHLLSRLSIAFGTFRTRDRRRA
jgi:hypothetical protein